MLYVKYYHSTAIPKALLHSPEISDSNDKKLIDYILEFTDADDL